jgi:putative Mg2+ transporter-C (MgtC) family protein
MTLEAIRNIQLDSLLDSLISLSTAFLLGSLIGLERQYRQRTAGLRTNVLVAVGAAIFVDMANRLYGAEGAVRVVAYVVSGIGFLGAGVIMREGGNVQGLNTAATLWGSAAVGACAGADLVLEAGLGSIFVLLANTVMRPVVNRMNRRPIDTPEVEVTNRVYVIAPAELQKEALRALEAALQECGYPQASLAVHPFGDRDVEIEAVLIATSVVGEELDRVVARLESHEAVKQAFWSPSTGAP